LEPSTSDNLETPTPTRSAGTPAAARPRLWALVVLLAGGAILVLSVWLAPDERGYGTHRQLGLGECGMLITTGLPCPTCGMTTAFAYAVRGRFLAAFLAQPAGLLLALGTAAAVAVAAWVLVTGRVPNVRLPIITPYRLFLGLLVILMGSWAFKIVLGLATDTLPARG
jgi:hypothetical protein